MSYSSEILENSEDLEPLDQPPKSPKNSLEPKWNSTTVPKTVQQGMELREQKKKNVFHQKLRPVSVNARGPCDPPKCKSANYRKTKPKITRPKSTVVCCETPSLNRVFTQSARSKRVRSRSQSRDPCGSARNGSGREKCPLRIAELAEPSKRHCLNTWRAMPDTLPAHMLDRLQQRIMDQRPVVQLDEAINFFQVRGRKKRPTTPKPLLRPEPSEQEIKYLCAIFARNMAKKLMKPICTDVTSPRMVNLVNTVSKEITKVLKNRQICTIESTSDNETIQLEISVKIAMWIMSIMKDADDRLLENELRAKNEKERRKGKDGRIRTLIEKYLRYHCKDRDLEEEEGPALDFIDEMIENVMTFCQVELSSDSATNTGNDEDREGTGDDGDRDSSKDQDPDLEAHGEHNIRNDSDNPDKNENLDESGNKEHEEKYPEEEIENELSKIEDSLPLEVTSPNDMEENLNVEQLGTNEDTENVSPEMGGPDLPQEVSGIMEARRDERKVKFTSLDSGSAKLEENAQRPETPEKLTESLQKSTNHAQSDIIFAPPNLGLLSDADESWPEEHAHGIGIKFSESVSKSITSLGHIEEKDEKSTDMVNTSDKGSEKNLHDPKYDTGIEHGTYQPDGDNLLLETTEFAEQKNLDMSSDVNSNILTTQDLRPTTTEFEDEKPETKYVIPQIKIEIKKKASADIMNMQTIDENPSKVSNTFTKPKTSDSGYHTGKFNDNVCTTDCYVVEDGKGDRFCMKNEVAPTLPSNVCPTSASKRKSIYKVPATIRNLQESDDSLSNSSRSSDRIGPYEAQRWCEDLQRTVDNLCHWHNWIEDACNKMLSIQQKSVLQRVGQRKQELLFKEWVDLKSDIDNDAALWTKLKDQTEVALGTYRKRVKPKGVCKLRKRSRRDAIFDKCSDIDKLSMWIERLIVSTEYCMKCKCKYYSRNH